MPKVKLSPLAPPESGSVTLTVPEAVNVPSSATPRSGWFTVSSGWSLVPLILAVTQVFSTPPLPSDTVNSR